MCADGDVDEVAEEGPNGRAEEGGVVGGGEAKRRVGGAGVGLFDAQDFAPLAGQFETHRGYKGWVAADVAEDDVELALRQELPFAGEVHLTKITRYFRLEKFEPGA